VKVPATAMVLAAGLGTRMRPLTLDRPKALVELAGKTLIEHMLDRLAEAGVERAVVNLHAFADLLESRLKARREGPQVIFSDERAALLETGGGVKAARPLLGEDPILIANIDSVWTGGEGALRRLCAGFTPGAMQARLLLAPTAGSIGFDGPGDFFLEADGRLRPRRSDPDAKTAPFAYVGVHVADPQPIYASPLASFSLFPIWAAAAAQGRLYGETLDGGWMHVGDPAARAAAETRLAPERA
jgi:MurNAc alpha-1-phosphate uridylyltransferase